MKFCVFNHIKTKLWNQEVVSAKPFVILFTQSRIQPMPNNQSQSMFQSLNEYLNPKKAVGTRKFLLDY